MPKRKDVSVEHARKKPRMTSNWKFKDVTASSYPNEPIPNEFGDFFLYRPYTQNSMINVAFNAYQTDPVFRKAFRSEARIVLGEAVITMDKFSKYF